MKRTGAHSRTAWTTKDRWNVRAPTIATLRCVVSQQVKTGSDEINKSKICSTIDTHQSGAAGCANDCRFAIWRINQAPFAKMIDQPVSNFECSAVGANVFADYKHSRVAFHLFPDALANCFNQRRLAATFGPR